MTESQVPKLRNVGPRAFAGLVATFAAGIVVAFAVVTFADNRIENAVIKVKNPEESGIKFKVTVEDKAFSVTKTVKPGDTKRWVIKEDGCGKTRRYRLLVGGAMRGRRA